MNRFISIDEAALRDAADPLGHLRAEFHLPTLEGQEVIYLTGNSIGLQPVGAAAAITTELESWITHGVEGYLCKAGETEKAVNYMQIYAMIRNEL